jgi:hypothetical protein
MRVPTRKEGCRGEYRRPLAHFGRRRLSDVTDLRLPSKVDITAGASVVLPALALGPRGDVRTYPNPFGSTGLSIEYETASEDQTEVIIHALSGDVVWKYSPGPVKGLNHIHWMGTSIEHKPLPASAYWVVVRKDGVQHYNLVFKP